MGKTSGSAIRTSPNTVQFWTFTQSRKKASNEYLAAFIGAAL